MKKSVCLLIRNSEGQYLGVARRENHEEWGLPGGKVDPGEDHVTAAVRELNEETGLIVKPDEIFPVYTDICYGKDGQHFLTTTFFVENYYFQPGAKKRRLDGDAGPVDWHWPEALADGPFGTYNKGLFDAIYRFGIDSVRTGIPIEV